MPATEKTWRSLKLMHVVFGVSALLMLITTIWMLWADHVREWKDYQRAFMALEQRTSQTRLREEETTEFVKKQDELEAKIAAARATPPDAALVKKFIDEAAPQAVANGYDLDAVNAALTNMKEVAGSSSADAGQKTKARARLIAALDGILRRAAFIETNISTRRKSEKAKLDVANSTFSIGVDESVGPEELSIREQAAKAQEQVVNELTLAYQAALTHRKALEATFVELTAAEKAAEKSLAEHQADIDRLNKAIAVVSPSIGKSFLEMPIVDAFNSPLKIDQIWLPQLTLNNNFRDVARFDRCTTCHKGLEKTEPGSAIKPGYEHEHQVVASLPTPKTAPAKAGDPQPKLNDVYGFTIARSVFNPDEIVVDALWPRTPAATAQFRSGDVIEYINDVRIIDEETAYRYLLETVAWGQPLKLTLRRGVPHPFATHPRLDLFVGSMSPHKLGDFGCTICHDGQGSATQFKWASHSPNTPRQGEQWREEYGWFNNHHWIVPMMPERFMESRCVKCHHELTELEPSAKFPEPPAPKLMAGYNIVREMGCFGCHEIQGWDGPNKRRGPDIRTEPPFFAAAAQLLIDPALTESQRRMAEEVIAHPENTATRKRLALDIQSKPADGKMFTETSLRMAGILGADDEAPGQYRRVGPSLRYVASKVDFSFLYNWVKNPRDFRPSTKMPVFFGLWSHLVPEEVFDPATGKPVLHDGHVVTENPGLDQSKRFEPIEVRGITTYLLGASQPFEYLEPPKGAIEAANADRGKKLFELRGCLACHKHPDFKDATNEQGPDLARLGSKLQVETGRKWLYSWVRNPNRYHARTVMPILFLDPTTASDGKTTDPAADITAFLLSSQGWDAPAVPAKLDDGSKRALDDLVEMLLTASFTVEEARQYAKTGIPESTVAARGDDALLLVNGKETPEQLEHKKLNFIGRRTIGRLGCSGCHDIPGFEDAKPIGTGLADWGRKDTSQLAFEQIIPFLAEYEFGGHGDPHSVHDGRGNPYEADPHATQEIGHSADEEGHSINLKDIDQDTGFYLEKLLAHERTGFIWQKIREPRSYDFMKTQFKAYTDRLRMPKFNLSATEREQLITFVLGLTGDPPAAKYIYKPDRERDAIRKGQGLLTKYNCTGCHTLEMETWKFDYEPDTFAPPPVANDFAFLDPFFTPKQLEDSKAVDRRGLGHASITGMPNMQEQEDPETGEPMYYFQLWRSVAINGEPWPVGGVDVPVLQSRIVDKRPPVGGALARLLHPVVLADERKTNPNAKESDAWGWVPPPLLNEGRKVRTDWMHDFLLDPYRIRPAVVLRMPKFNMSSDEATALTNYFAAVDGVDFPYEFSPRSREDHLAAGERQHPNRLNDALKLITDNNYCVKCHLIGDFAPTGSPAALAPQFSQVHNRFRPDFLRDWIANPRRMLPYTGMPQNFPPDKPASQALFPGDSLQQINGVVDLLLNWPQFMQDKTSIRPLVKPPEAAPPAAAAGNGSAPKVANADD